MDFTRKENIQRFKKMLAGDLDPVKRFIVESLLAEQKAKLADDFPTAQEGLAEAAGMPDPVWPPPQSALMSVDVLSLIADSVICTDEDGRIVAFNRAAEQSFGYSAGEVIGQPVEMLLPQRFRAEHVLQVRSFAVEDGAAGRLMGHRRQVWGLRKSGEEFPIEAMVSRQPSDGSPILTVVLRDITERKELEEQREAIARELDHRIRNLLSVVISLVSLSARSAESVGGFKESLLQRLRALAATQNALRNGALQSIGLNELLMAELAQYRTPDGANVIVEVPPIAVAPTPAQTLALAFHELATNSAKYGALSDADGVVIVTATVVGEGKESRIVVEWRDAGGPPVKPPTRQGLGTTLIKEVIQRTFRGEVILEYPPEGLVCRMTLPTAAVEAGRGEIGARVLSGPVREADPPDAPMPPLQGPQGVEGGPPA